MPLIQITTRKFEVDGETRTELVAEQVALEQGKTPEEIRDERLADATRSQNLDFSLPEEMIQQRNQQVTQVDAIKDAPASVQQYRREVNAEGAVRLVPVEAEEPPVEEDTGLADDAQAVADALKEEAEATTPPEVENEAQEATEEVEEEAGPVCPFPGCGKVCANDFGLRAHMRSHKDKE